jgi:hypothetical protein
MTTFSPIVVLLRDDSPRRTLKVCKVVDGFYVQRDTGSGYNVRSRHQGFTIVEGAVLPDGGRWRFRVPQSFLKSIRNVLA